MAASISRDEAIGTPAPLSLSDPPTSEALAAKRAVAPPRAGSRDWLRLTALLACAVLATACPARREAASDAGSRTAAHGHSQAAAAEAAAKRTVELRASFDPVRAAFNASRGRPRLVAILANSCPRCRQGVVAVAGPTLDARPDLAVFLIWTRVLPNDGGARKRIETFYDPERITHFSDPDRVAARALAAELGWPAGELAYDLFLLFDSEVVWDESMPTPAAWFHQRRDREPDRYRTEEALERALVEAARGL